MNKPKTTFKDAIRDALEEEMERDERIIILGEDVLGYEKQSTLEGFEEKFPGRILNRIPLVEDMLGGIGLGMNLGGLKPVIQMDYSTFITLGLHDIYRLGNWRYRMAEKEGPGVVLRIGHGGYGGGGAEFDASLLGTIFHLPNLWIAAPATPYHAKGLLKTALRANRPVIFFENKAIYQKSAWVPEEEYTVPFGTSSVYKSGKDITLIAWSFMTHLAMRAAARLGQEGIEPEVIDLATLHPMDMKTIMESVRKTGRAVIVEEDMLRGGIGAEISAQIAEALPGCKIKRIASKNVPLAVREKGKFILPTTEDIIAACLNILKA